MKVWILGALTGGLVLAAVDPRVRFANDLGPSHVDVSGYPAVIREGYALFEKKCATCHSPARALNSEFVELSEAESRKALSAQPSLAADPRLWKIEPGIWKRYVKRMAAKSGSTMTSSEAMQIYAFLVHDSKARKIGDRAAEWRSQRTQWLQKFRQTDSTRYRELYGEVPAAAEKK